MKRLITLTLLLFTSQAYALFTPQEALEEALASDLKLVGKFVPSYSESGRIPVCVYRNSKVVLYQYYCTKQRISAFGTRIHSIDPNRGFVTIYAETAKDDDITKVKRDRYADTHWYMSSKRNGSTFKFNGTINDFKKYDLALSKDPSPGCITSRTFPLHCKPEYAGEAQSWGGPAQDFWNKPTDTWYELIRLLNTKAP